MSPSPPRWASALLARALENDEAGPAILGDLHERFTEVSEQSGARRARLWYAGEAVSLAFTTTALGALAFIKRIPRSGQNSMRAILFDAQNAFRAVRRDLAFFLFASTIIGVGAGASASVYSVVRPLLLQPLPFEQSDRLVWIANGGGGESTPGTSTPGSSPLLLRDFRDFSRSFEGITGYNAGFDIRSHTLSGSGEPERLVGIGVARDFLDVLGVEPLLGRSFAEEDAVFGGSKTAILTHGFWVRRFGADPGVVGTSVTIDTDPVQVVGVLPPPSISHRSSLRARVSTSSSRSPLARRRSTGATPWR